jgi:glutathione peroxidase
MMTAFLSIAAAGFLILGSIRKPDPSILDQSSIYDFTMKTIDGEDRSLSTYKGKVLLVVNVASKCGYTPQYEGLQDLYEKYKDRGLVILGFPSNNFKGQEPGTDSEIKEFCSTNYGITFDMFSKIEVVGNDQHPLYHFITTQPVVEGPVKWNFQKYLVSRKGEVKAKFFSKTEPLDEELTGTVEQLLSETE